MEITYTRKTIKKLPIVKHPMPPNFVNPRSGRYVVYPGGGWYLVTDDVTRKDIESRWRTFKAKEAVVVPKGDIWSVPGSKGKEYIVSFLNMNWGCTCPGFGFRRKCKHIDTLKADV